MTTPQSTLDKLIGIEIDAGDRRAIRIALAFIALVVSCGLGWAIKAGNAEVIKSIVSDATWAGVALVFILIAGVGVKRGRKAAPPPAEPTA